MKKELMERTSKLFSIDYEAHLLTESEKNIVLSEVKELIDHYGWDIVYQEWFHYLKEECKTQQDVTNWAHLFWWFTGCDYPIPDPYELLGYLYSHVDVKDRVLNSETLFYSIATTFLQPLGYVDLWNDPYYEPLEDPKILKAMEKWK